MAEAATAFHHLDAAAPHQFVGREMLHLGAVERNGTLGDVAATTCRKPRCASASRYSSGYSWPQPSSAAAAPCPSSARSSRRSSPTSHHPAAACKRGYGRYGRRKWSARLFRGSEGRTPPSESGLAIRLTSPAVRVSGRGCCSRRARRERYYFVTIGEGRQLAPAFADKAEGDQKTEPIRCIIDTANDPREISLDDSVTRENMHPADQFEAFKKLSEERGLGADQIDLLVTAKAGSYGRCLAAR